PGDPALGLAPLSALARVLVVNAGSSSLKLRLLDESDAVVASGDLGTVGPSTRGELGELLESWPSFYAVGHRVVHGGDRFVEPTVIDGEVVDELRALSVLAPLHQP